MKIKRLFEQFARSSTSIKITAITAIVVWMLVLAAVIAGTALLLERPGQARQSAPGPVPAISLEPLAGPAGTLVAVRGEGWTPGSAVLIYLLAPGETILPNYALASAVADPQGRFTTEFVIPPEPRWENRGVATVMARAAGGGAAAQALFGVVSETQPTATLPEPTATPTGEEQTSPPPAPMSQPARPLATATVNLNIRGGPGTDYPVLGVLRDGKVWLACGRGTSLPPGHEIDPGRQLLRDTQRFRTGLAGGDPACHPGLCGPALARRSWETASCPGNVLSTGRSRWSRDRSALRARILLRRS